MEFQAYSVGLISASVCTSLPIDQATQRLNTAYPTGISSKWQPSEDTHFKCGTPIGCQCPDYKDNKHFLFNC